MSTQRRVLLLTSQISPSASSHRQPHLTVSHISPSASSHRQPHLTSHTSPPATPQSHSTSGTLQYLKAIAILLHTNLHSSQPAASKNRFESKARSLVVDSSNLSVSQISLSISISHLTVSHISHLTPTSSLRSRLSHVRHYQPLHS